MPDPFDPDAIQRRHEEHLAYDGGDRIEALGYAEASANDVPALLARLAEAEEAWEAMTRRVMELEDEARTTARQLRELADQLDTHTDRR